MSIEDTQENPFLIVKFRKEDIAFLLKNMGIQCTKIRIEEIIRECRSTMDNLMVEEGWNVLKEGINTLKYPRKFQYRCRSPQIVYEGNTIDDMLLDPQGSVIYTFNTLHQVRKNGTVEYSGEYYETILDFVRHYIWVIDGDMEHGQQYFNRCTGEISELSSDVFQWIRECLTEDFT